MAPQRTKRDSPTPERILDIAERLVQTRGFNSFSYAHIAKQLGITTASLHYHFRGKAELGQALVTRYTERFAEGLGRIDREVPDAPAKLKAYASLYAGVLEGKRMCMCGVLAAEYPTLPKPMRRAVIDFFDENVHWLTGVLTQGRTEKTLAFSGSSEETAQSILSTLEGAMLVARSYGNPGKFEATVHRMLADLDSHRVRHD